VPGVLRHQLQGVHSHGVLTFFSDRGLTVRPPAIGRLAFDVLLPFLTKLTAIFEDVKFMNRYFSSQ
jgi:hypothetical protein